MSPFTEVSDRIAERIRLLDLRRQVALFGCAAEALAPGYTMWRMQAHEEVRDDTDLLEAAVQHARAFAIDGRVPPTDLLDQIEAATPSDPSDVPNFTTAQDCWICADTAVRAIADGYEPAESAWYLLEPSFQATSERLFGYADVGSAQQQAAESQALGDVRLQEVLSAIGAALDVAQETPTDDGWSRMGELLGVINPADRQS